MPAWEPRPVIGSELQTGVSQTMGWEPMALSLASWQMGLTSAGTGIVCLDRGYSLLVLNCGQKQDCFNNCGCQQEYKALHGYTFKCRLQKKTLHMFLQDGWSSRIACPTFFLQNGWTSWADSVWSALSQRQIPTMENSSLNNLLTLKAWEDTQIRMSRNLNYSCYFLHSLELDTRVVPYTYLRYKPE